MNKDFFIKYGIELPNHNNNWDKDFSKFMEDFLESQKNRKYVQCSYWYGRIHERCSNEGVKSKPLNLFSLSLDFPPIFVTLLRVRKRLDMFTEGHVSKTILSFFGFRCSQLQANNQYPG